MSNQVHLLSPNSTSLERAAAAALAELQQVPVPLRQLWSPSDCPEHLLPYLAWAFSVDRWDPNWATESKRAVIRASWAVHKRKGTISAIRRVVEPLGYLLEIEEWWQTDPEGPRGTFALRIGVLDTGITDHMYDEVIRLIEDAKPLTRHITGLDLLGETRGPFYIGTATYDGDTTAVYPYTPAERQVNGTTYVGAAMDVHDAAMVYPQYISTIATTMPYFIGIGLDVIDTTTVYPR